MTAADSYHDEKVYHLAHKFREDGAVSALCFKSLRPINLKIALWTIRPDAVTCPKCKRAIREATP